MILTHTHTHLQHTFASTESPCLCGNKPVCNVWNTCALYLAFEWYCVYMYIHVHTYIYQHTYRLFEGWWLCVYSCTRYMYSTCTRYMYNYTCVCVYVCVCPLPALVLMCAINWCTLNPGLNGPWEYNCITLSDLTWPIVHLRHHPWVWPAHSNTGICISLTSSLDPGCPQQCYLPLVGPGMTPPSPRAARNGG